MQVFNEAPYGKAFSVLISAFPVTIILKGHLCIHLDILTLRFYTLFILASGEKPASNVWQLFLVELWAPKAKPMKLSRLLASENCCKMSFFKIELLGFTLRCPKVQNRASHFRVKLIRNKVQMRFSLI